MQHIFQYNDIHDLEKITKMYKKYPITDSKQQSKHGIDCPPYKPNQQQQQPLCCYEQTASPLDKPEQIGSAVGSFPLC